MSFFLCPSHEAKKPWQKLHRLEFAVAMESRVLEISGSKRAASAAQQGQLLLANMKGRLKKQSPDTHTIQLLENLCWFLCACVCATCSCGW